MSAKDKRLFEFTGEAMLFERSIGSMKMSTAAVSIEKAKSNICYRIRQQMGYVPQTKIRLCGKITIWGANGTAAKPEKVVYLG